MWASVVSLPRDGLPTLPFSCVDPHSGDSVTIDTIESVDVLFNSWPENHEARWEFAQLLGVGHMLIDKGFQDILRRKQYCERYHVPPFKGGYEDQPEWWLTALETVDRAEAEATNFMRRKHGK